MNLPLHPSRGSPDSPGVDRYTLSELFHPRLPKSVRFYGNELRIGQPKGQTALNGREVVAND